MGRMTYYEDAMKLTEAFGNNGGRELKLSEE